MLRTVFYFIALFFLLRFVLRVVLPMLRLTSETSRRVRRMQEEMNSRGPAGPEPKRSIPKDEYIEYEEVK